MDKPSFYSVLPANVRYSEELSWFEKILYAEITSLCNKDGYCFAKNSYFADVFDLSESQVRRAIGSLAKLGFVRVLIENGNERKIYITDSSSDAEENAESTERREEETKGVQDEGVRKNAGARKNETEGAQKCASLVDTTSTVDSNINNINNNIKKIYLSVLGKLNEVCGSGFRDSAKNKKHIVARIREGYSLADFETVIRSQHALWGNDPVMCRYLRPETLFGGKFAGYLEAAKMAERVTAGGQNQATRPGSTMSQAEKGRKAEEISMGAIEERMRFMFSAKFGNKGRGKSE